MHTVRKLVWQFIDCLKGSHWRHAFRKRSTTLRRLKPNVLRFRRHNVLEHFRNSCNAIWTCSLRQKPVLYVGKLSILKKLTWVTFFKTHRLPSSSGAQCTVARTFLQCMQRMEETQVPALGRKLCLTTWARLPDDFEDLSLQNQLVFELK